MRNRQPLIAGNWKLNGTRSSVVSLSESVAKAATQVTAEILLCPASVHLSDVLNVVGNTAVKLGAQNCSQHEKGAFTGECSVNMLAEFGCEYVIVGHSERRDLFGETDEIVAAKFFAVQKAGLTPILCVGESLEDRRAGKQEAVVVTQLEAVIAAPDFQPSDLAGAVIAYEPVWAIGTGETASPAQAQEVHSIIRRRISSMDESIAQHIRIIYGGSVNPASAPDLFVEEDIDGGLVGGASLKAEDFVAICLAAGE